MKIFFFHQNPRWLPNYAFKLVESLELYLKLIPSYHFTHIKYVNMSLYDPTSDISNLYVFQ